MKNKLLYVIISFFAIACNTNSYVAKYDYSYLYDSDQKVINPHYKIYHSDTDSSVLHFKINSSDILYGRIRNDSSLKARLKLKYRLYTDDQLNTFISGDSLNLVNTGNNENEASLQSQVKINVPSGKQYLLEVLFRDVNKDLNIRNLIKVDKRLNVNSQYFLFKSGDKILFNEVQSSDSAITILKSPLIQTNNFTANLSEANFPMSPPPFVESYSNKTQIKVDSSFDFSFDNSGTYELKKYKSYNQLIAQNDSIFRSSYFYHFYRGFPEIVKIDQLIEPIRYISTSSEYRSLKAAVDKKKAVDNFWLKLCDGDEERAQKVIKEFYRRVETSNTYFTDFREGWKTDRGIIYIIYGNPTTIYKDSDKETWIYGEENNILSVKYDFYNVNNELSNNIYELGRDSNYKNNWYRAVDMWRQAKIY